MSMLTFSSVLTQYSMCYLSYGKERILMSVKRLLTPIEIV